MPELVRYAQAGDVAVIVMDDGKANALQPAMSEGLDAALDRAAVEAKAVVIAGRPGVFCGGYDLRIIRGEDAALRTRMRDLGTALMLRFYLSPQPLVIACTGHGVAAGAILLMAADYRIGASGDFKFGLNETAIGLALPQVALELARDRLEERKLQQATVMATLYDPAGAVAVGYLDETVEPGVLMERAVAKAAELAKLDAAAYAETKRRLRQATVDRIVAAG